MGGLEGFSLAPAAFQAKERLFPNPITAPELQILFFLMLPSEKVKHHILIQIWESLRAGGGNWAGKSLGLYGEKNCSEKKNLHLPSSICNRSERSIRICSAFLGWHSHSSDGSAASKPSKKLWRYFPPFPYLFKINLRCFVVPMTSPSHSAQECRDSQCPPSWGGFSRIH